SAIDVDEFSDSEAKDLDTVVTNVNDNIYAWKIGDALTPEQAGALLSRYSRTSLTGRRLYLKEFLPNKHRGSEFFNAWLVDYGDDSIQEMAGGIPTSCEYISNVAAKEIEDSRMGSYIEKSTRYVSFDKKFKNGDYMFYKDPAIMSSKFADDYLALMTDLFDSYIKHTEPMSKYIKDNNPIDKQKFNIGNHIINISELSSKLEEELGVTAQDLQKSYDNAIKANALDFMRDYLPMSILTHVGVSMNARSYENTIIKLLSSPLYECNSIGNKMHAELSKVVPSLLNRINEKHGLAQRAYISSTRHDTLSTVTNLTHNIRLKEDKELIRLVDYTGKGSKDPDMVAENDLAAFIIYKAGNGYSLAQCKEIAASLNKGQKDLIISKYIGERKNRRHKPGRAFENIYYTFDSCCRIGIYRDLQRHRIGTQERQSFTVRHGYNMRDQYRHIGIDEDYLSKVHRVIELYNKIAQTMPYQAQYVVTFGFNIRWYYTFNARQLFHFCELRTGPGGHPDYRDLTQKAFHEVAKVHPSISKHLNFINLEAKHLGRLESEIRIAQKKNKLENQQKQGA
ncbi:MAG: FAD-dependent thymidylate synthase, partial [Candidatus Micrarchaeota archaeon]|nr:FAD-dependent thymidylate synthase [Candidatus Micrarchaeota archaeon]